MDSLNCSCHQRELGNFISLYNNFISLLPIPPLPFVTLHVLMTGDCTPLAVVLSLVLTYMHVPMVVMLTRLSVNQKSLR